MPVLGLTDNQTIRPRFPRIGKLRKGGEKTSANKPGPELDYWRFTSNRLEVVKAFEAALGKQPRQINVYLPFVTIEDNFPTWKEAWKAGGLQHRCDAVTCTIWLDDTGAYQRVPKPCPGGCKEVGRLEVVIPELLQAGFVGTVTMETHSLNDMISITETLSRVAEMRQGNPLGLRGILFNLRRVPQMISVPGWGKNAGKRQRVEKQLVKIAPAVDWVTAQMALARTEMPALAAPADPPPDTGDDFTEGEFVEPEPGADADIPAGLWDSAPEVPIPHTEGYHDAQASETARPYSPEVLRGFIVGSAEEKRTANFTYGEKAANYRGAVRGNLELCFAGDPHSDQKRRLVSEYLTGKASSRDWDDAMIATLHKWLNAKKDAGGTWLPDPLAEKEAVAVAKAAALAAGQTEMDLA